MEQDFKIPDTPSWKCSKCGFTLQAKMPPEKCKSCGEDCEFIDVTSYTPEGGFRGIDPRL